MLVPAAEFWLFVAFFLAFAIKVPLFPFHTWLPDAHVEAPTAGSVLLAGVLLKMGTYGLVRFSLPLFPHVSHLFAPLISGLAIIGIIYGALVAMVQPDMKKLVAYSSVSHLGFVVLGIFSFNVQGMEGAIYQMMNHGVSTGALFLLVGVIYDRRHTRLIEEFGGLANRMPVYAAFFLIVTLSSIGLPGLNGFVGEFLVLLGTFGANTARAVLAATGVILSAVYMLWMYQRVIWGEITNDKNKSLLDLVGRERVMLIPLADPDGLDGRLFESFPAPDGRVRGEAHEPGAEPARARSTRMLEMNLATINISAILPAVVLSVFGIAVMVAEPFVERSEASRSLGWLALAGTIVVNVRLFSRWQVIVASGTRICGSLTTTASSSRFSFF